MNTSCPPRRSCVASQAPHARRRGQLCTGVPSQRGSTYRTLFGVQTSGATSGLRWVNVDTASAHVVISEGVVRGIETDRTKTNVARTVALNSRALAAVKAQKAHTYLAGEHVFHDPRYGARWGDERAFRRNYWEPTLKRLGIRYRPPYSTRHTYATMMLMAGMAPAFCAGQMGHSVEIFHRTYAKWIPGSADAGEMAKLEASFGGPRPTVTPFAKQ